MAKILIVDDDAEILELLKFTFEAERYNVLTASDGETGLLMAEQEHPDLIIMDVNMPKLSGFEVCQKIRENGATCLIPVIMLTSQNQVKDRITGIKLGADEYLGKPFEPMELVARVEGLLRRTRESLAANPLTGLPGNVTIETEIKRRIEAAESFAVIFTDIDHFKSFNDKYGFERGDNIIRLFAVILRSVVQELGNKNDFLAHVGAEDFIMVTTSERVSFLADRIIEIFDTLIFNQYDEEVRKRGYLWGVDRQGKEMQYPIMTVSLGAVTADPGKFRHYSQVVDKAKEMLTRAKAHQGSILALES